jgi:putative transposase
MPQTFCFRVSAIGTEDSIVKDRVFMPKHFDHSVIILCVGWYLAYSLSLRDLEEMMAERGISVDHATVHLWVIRYSPELLNWFNTHKRPVTGE